MIHKHLKYIVSKEKCQSKYLCSLLHHWLALRNNVSIHLNKKNHVRDGIFETSIYQ